MSDMNRSLSFLYVSFIDKWLGPFRTCALQCSVIGSKPLVPSSLLTSGAKRRLVWAREDHDVLRVHHARFRARTSVTGPEQKLSCQFIVMSCRNDRRHHWDSSLAPKNKRHWQSPRNSSKRRLTYDILCRSATYIRAILMYQGKRIEER